MGAHMRMAATIVLIHQCIVVSSIKDVGYLNEGRLGLFFKLILIIVDQEILPVSV